MIMVMIFTFLAVTFTAFMLTRTNTELADARLKAAKVKSLFNANSALARAHQEINENMNSPDSQAANENVALSEPVEVGNEAYVNNTNLAVRVRTVKPSDHFDEDGEELAPLDEDGDETAYESLPDSWYCLEARVFEPLYTDAEGQKWGQLKLARQYVRDGTPLSNNFLAVIDDDLGLGGSPTNPGKPAEGEIHTNKHLYIMTPNPYYANRLLAVDGVSYIAGAAESSTVYLHPDNNFEADPLYLPLPSSLTSNADDPDDTLKNHALGSSPSSVTLTAGTQTISGKNITVALSGIATSNDIKKTATDPAPSVKLNFDSDGICRGVCVEGYIHHEVVMEGSTMSIKLTKYNDANKYVLLTNVPAPDDGVLFFDTRTDVGGVAARTKLKGDVETRMTMATTGNIDISGSIKYRDSEGDYATKLVSNTSLDGVDDADLGTVTTLSDTSSYSSMNDVTYFANKRPAGLDKVDGDGFYDNDAVLGVVASQDIIYTSAMPQNAEVSGSFLSLQKRLTLEGLTYNSSGQLTGLSGVNPFYINNGGRTSFRRFGGMISYKRPCTTVVNNSGGFLYGFKTGFSLFDEDMKQKPPPFFPKDKKPQYLGWELKDLGVKPIAAN